jgi:hypothetical protein
MFTVKPLESKSNKNEARMHFTWSPAALGSFKLPLNGLCEIFIVHHQNGPAVGKLKTLLSLKHKKLKNKYIFHTIYLQKLL